jgi:hypothetical protein
VLVTSADSISVGYVSGSAGFPNWQVELNDWQSETTSCLPTIQGGTHACNRKVEFSACFYTPWSVTFMVSVSRKYPDRKTLARQASHIDREHTASPMEANRKVRCYELLTGADLPFQY